MLGGSATACNCVRVNCVLELRATACRFVVLPKISFMLAGSCKTQETTQFNVALRATRTACKCVQLRATYTLRATALGLEPPRNDDTLSPTNHRVTGDAVNRRIH